jgi:DnaJ-class molecular chaperone
MGGRHRDYYSVLGVARDAGTEAIKRAFRRLAKHLHPDAGTEGSADAFREVRVAFETLSNAEQRRRYDEALALAESSSFTPATNAALLPTRPQAWVPSPPTTIAGEIVLTAAEARAGGMLPLHVPVESVCPQCVGTGGPLFDCLYCEGDGVIAQRVPVDLVVPRGVTNGALFQVSIPRPALTLLFSIVVRPF